MSGLEIAGVVVGVLPLLVEAVKGYSSISARFRTIRHFSKEIKKIKRQLDVRHGIFKNECRLLLLLFEDEKGADAMLKDENDLRWRSKAANENFNQVLKNSFDLCESILDTSIETIDGMKEELEKFDVFSEKKRENESIKDAIHRLRDSVRITFDKSKYEKSLISLRDCNDELSQLRAQVGEFRRGYSSTSCGAPQALPPCIHAIKNASQKLHEALSESWCCGDSTHGEHYAKLCLDAEVQAGVCLDLAISCQESFKSSGDGYMLEPPIWLYVQSRTIDSETSPKADIHVATSTKRPMLEEDYSEKSQCVQKKATSIVSQFTMGKKKQKKQVRFTNVEDDSIKFSGQPADEVLLAVSKTVIQQTTPSIDLCQTKNICHYLKQNLQICRRPLNNHCVGYLESPTMYRHMFYLREEKPLSIAKERHAAETTISSVFDVLGQEVDDTLTVVDQLRLAHKTALAVLQFNDTPWLSQRWRLKDLSYFGSRNGFNEDALKTLHTSSQIASAASTANTGMEIVEDDSGGACSEEEYYGINNTILFFLGVAMLEIAHWKSIESLGIPRDPNEICTARRIASRSTKLGPKYESITRKCIQCNFGFGTDLSKKELQAAVYNDVVCQLESMVESLTI